MLKSDMNTTYFLHGGRCELESESNRSFYNDIVNHFSKNNINILCVYFARPFERWEESFNIDLDRFLSVDSEKDLTLKMAELEDFDKQISNSDIVFFAGGKRGCLREKLLDIDTENLFKGKLIVGISAGANMLSKYYYSTVANEVREGIGILPIKIFTHCTKEKESEIKELEGYKEELPLYKVREEEYIVLV